MELRPLTRNAGVVATPPITPTPGRTRPEPVSQRDSLLLSSVKRVPPAASTLDVGTLESRISAETGTKPTTGNRMNLLIDGTKAYAAIFDLIGQAKNSLNLEFFIFKDDQTSWDVAEALAEAAQRGVKVRLSVDWTMSPTSSPIFDFLRANGVEVRHFTADSLKAPTRADHRKILVADGTRAITGGMNVADEYHHTWHDLMTEVEGPVVADLQRQFIQTWHDVGGSPIEDMAALFPAAATAPKGNATMRVLTTQPQESIRQGLFAAIDAARDTIRIEVPYFTDDALAAKLAAAAKRGVTVHLILPAESNHAIVDTAGRHHLKPLADAGVQIHLYEGRMSHTKAASVDGVWATIGSCNGDNLSLRYNRELNVTVSDPETVAAVDRDLFAKDMAASRLLKPKPMTWTQSLSTWAARRLNFTL